MNPTERYFLLLLLLGLIAHGANTRSARTGWEEDFMLEEPLLSFFISVSTEKATTNKRRRGNNRPPQSQGKMSYTDQVVVPAETPFLVLQNS